MPEEDDAPIAHELEVSTSEGGGLWLPPFSLARAFGTMQEVISWFGSEVSGGLHAGSVVGLMLVIIR